MDTAPYGMPTVSQKYSERTNRWMNVCTVWALLTWNTRLVYGCCKHRPCACFLRISKGRELGKYCGEKKKRKKDAYCQKYSRKRSASITWLQSVNGKHGPLNISPHDRRFSFHINVKVTTFEVRPNPCHPRRTSPKPSI